jgi:hypothetical protein
VLGVNTLSGFGGGTRGGGAVTLTFITDLVSNSSGTAHTFSGADLGTSGAKKLVLCFDSPAQGKAISSVTIDGESCALAVQDPGLLYNQYYTDAVTATSGDIVITYGATNARTGIGLFQLDGAASGGPSDTDEDASHPGDLSLTVPAGAAVVANGCCEGSSAQTWSWDTIDEAWDNQYSDVNLTSSGGGKVFTSAQSPLAIQATASASAMDGVVGAVYDLA